MNKDKVIRYLMTLALVLIAASVSAQHVKFKGIPLGLYLIADLGQDRLQFLCIYRL